MDTHLRCPFCQQHNQCTVNNPTGCWCMNLQEVVPLALLSLLPESANNKQCICASCIEKFAQNPQDFAQHCQTLE